MSDADHATPTDPAIVAGHSVVAIGELLWDIFPDGRRLGGAPANFAYHARALGARSSLLSRVGADDLGTEALSRMRDHGVDVDQVTSDTNHATGTVSVTLDEDGEPSYAIHRDVAWDFIACPPESIELAETADALCFGTLAQRSETSRRTVLQLLDAAPPGCLRLLDVNLRQHFYGLDILRDALARADVLKVNETELRTIGALLGVAGDDATIVRKLVETFSLTAVAVTRGRRGAALWLPDDMVEHPGFPIAMSSPAIGHDEPDTVGAGDAFAAALCVGMLRGHFPGSIVENANRLAAFVCSRRGAMPDLPTELVENLTVETKS